MRSSLRLLLAALLSLPALLTAQGDGRRELDVPFEPTHPEAVEAMLRLASVGPQDYVIDLGCGDGRMVVAAAKQFGARGLGVDIDPRRVEEARANVAYEGLAERVRIEQGDIFDSDIREASVVTLYLLDTINLKLRPKLFRELRPGARVVSHAFHMEEWEADDIAHHPKARDATIRLWRIPAHAGGLWRTELATPAGGQAATLRLRQEYQLLFGAVQWPHDTTPIDEGVLRGERIVLRLPVVHAGQRASLECEGLVVGDQMTGVQHLTVGSVVTTTPWSAQRDAHDVAGTWLLRLPSRRDVGGKLTIERRDGLLWGTWESPGSEAVPLSAFYVWGQSILFKVKTGGRTLTFNGLLLDDRGEGTVNSESWSVAQRFLAARGAVAEQELMAQLGPLTPEATPSPSPTPGPAPSPPASRAVEASGPRPGQEYLNPQDGSVLVWIPGGEFEMGSDDGNDDERPRTKMKVEGFWMGKYEVTYAQYAEFLRATPTRYEPFYWSDKRYAQADLPVIGLTWNDARAYCKWVNLRLPTEAEWEYAAAGGRQLEYPTANGQISTELAACRDDASRKPSQLTPVGSFAPNPFGLFDLAGNAWEFTSTFYHPYPYTTADGREAPDTDEELIVLRGGSFGFPFRACRTSNRQYFAKHLRYDFAGLRVAGSAAQIAAQSAPRPKVKSRSRLKSKATPAKKGR